MARGAIFVLAATVAGQRGPVAALLSTAGWAAAARRVLGRSWVVTPAGTCTPEEVRAQGSASDMTSSGVGSWRRQVPPVVKTAVKDLRLAPRSRRRVVPGGPWDDTALAFVWQRHELFHTAGIELARALAVPSVLFVPATLVWEAREWGVARPGWGAALERVGERPALRAADVVACGTDAVAEQAVRLGTPPDRVLVTPTGVDLDLFSDPLDRGAARRRLGIGDRFVVGWVGSFRGFHSLDVIVDAVAQLEGTTLLLVGDGPERSAVEDRARRLGVDVRCTGTVPHADLPAHLAAMDAAVVAARAGPAFHYSPLKLAEYLAAGLPVVAPAVSHLQARLEDGVDALLVPPGDTAALVAALVRLRDDPGARAEMGAAALRSAAREWSWDRQVRRTLDRLGITA